MCFNTLNIIERLRELSATPWLRDPAHSLSLHSAMITTRMNLKWTEGHWEIQDKLKRTLVHYIIHCRTCRCLHRFCMFLLTLSKSSLPMRSLKNPCLVHNCAPSWCITLYRQCISFLVLRKSWTISSTPKVETTHGVIGSKYECVTPVTQQVLCFAVTNRTNYRVSGFLSLCDHVTNHLLTCGPMMWKHVETCGNLLLELFLWYLLLCKVRPSKLSNVFAASYSKHFQSAHPSCGLNQLQETRRSASGWCRTWGHLQQLMKQMESKRQRTLFIDKNCSCC